MYPQKYAIFNIYHVFAPFMQLHGCRFLYFVSLCDLWNQAFFLILEHPSLRGVKQKTQEKHKILTFKFLLHEIQLKSWKLHHQNFDFDWILFLQLCLALQFLFITVRLPGFFLHLLAISFEKNFDRLLAGFGMLVFFRNLSLIEFQVRYLALFLLF